MAVAKLMVLTESKVERIFTFFQGKLQKPGKIEHQELQKKYLFLDETELTDFLKR
jgi:hypothetical protein